MQQEASKKGPGKLTMDQRSSTISQSSLTCPGYFSNDVTTETLPVAEKRGSELLFQDVRACGSEAGLFQLPAYHLPAAVQALVGAAHSPHGGHSPRRGPVNSDDGMPGKPKHLGVPNGRMVLAVSDGELSSTAGSQGQSEGRGSSLSIHSLPSGPSGPFPTEDQPVASWALSFERLLQDPLGLAYFTEFLKKEFSAENVTFWKACERFQQIPASDTKQLAQEARNIYQEFLSSQALSPVNIDRQAWLGEEVLAEPRPDMFRAQQLQIFNLMKFDSYARFVKSPLYRECLLAEAEGRPLREPGSSHLGSPEASRKKPKLKPGKSLPLGVEELGQLPSTEGPGGRQLRKSFRRELAVGAPNLRRESQGSLNSSASLDLGFLAFVSSKSESHRKSLGSSEGDSENQLGKYCCVYLPDGTASLALARPGLTIRAMLAGICEKRGLSLPDVKVYLVGNEQKPLVLDQDCTVLADKEVRLETRITFELELADHVVRISTKPTKRLQEALQPVLAKHGLSPQQVSLHKPGEKQLLDLEKLVSSVAAQRLVLDTLPGVKIPEVSHTSPCRSQNPEQGSPPFSTTPQLAGRGVQ
ncbi:PREDICTED: regulator of G-protein signaling 14 isoform X2 [Condylura cristata]|uniref:regulator of G-protein signaling 14 isoform X2 n=1 Tax=Condylura cristata TaxID=143302 RepID=UPI00064301FA|nr:PREDICTED: regulator of G-protein signaling 14 isoform X2 [Condylura cristata]